MDTKKKKHPDVEPKDYSTETHLIYGKMEDPCWDYTHHLLPPITSSATFRLDSAQRGAQGFTEFAHSSDEVSVQAHAPIYIYDRLGEPNKDMLEENLAFADRGDTAVAFASGMAAISGVLGSLTGTGSEVVAHRVLYGCTYSLLTNWMPRFGVQPRYVDLANLEELRSAITPRTRVVYFETPVNPTMDLIDLNGVTKIVKRFNRKRKNENRIHVIVDNHYIRCLVADTA